MVASQRSRRMTHWQLVAAVRPMSDSKQKEARVRNVLPNVIGSAAHASVMDGPCLSMGPDRTQKLTW